MQYNSGTLFEVSALQKGSSEANICHFGSEYSKGVSYIVQKKLIILSFGGDKLFTTDISEYLSISRGSILV